MARANAPLALDIDPGATEVLLDPYPFHDALRDAGPVALVTPHDVYAVGRYDEAVTVLTDFERFSTTESPRHVEMRAAVHALLSPAAMRRLRAAMQREAGALVSRLIDQREVDAVRDVAQAFVTHVHADADDVRELVWNGMDATIAGLGSTLLNLARSADQWDTLRANPQQVHAAFEEGNRMETPIQTTCRITVRDTEIKGIALAANRKVVVYVGAANRDPRRWPAPNRYDLMRKTAGRLALGTGARDDSVQTIARLQAECLLTALLARVRAIEPAGAPAWRPVSRLRTLDRMALRLIPI